MWACVIVCVKELKFYFEKETNVFTYARFVVENAFLNFFNHLFAKNAIGRGAEFDANRCNRLSVKGVVENFISHCGRIE